MRPTGRDLLDPAQSASGPRAQVAKRCRERFAPSGIVLRRDRADTRKHDLRPQFVRHRERAIRPANPVVELVRRVERAPGGQGQRRQRQLDRPEQMPDLAASGFAQAMRRQLTRGIEHNAASAQPGGFVDLLTGRLIGVEAKGEWMTNHFTGWGMEDVDRGTHASSVASEGGVSRSLFIGAGKSAHVV